MEQRRVSKQRTVRRRQERHIKQSGMVEFSVNLICDESERAVAVSQFIERRSMVVTF